MKFSASKVDGFMRSYDPNIRAILIYGPDGGLVRERADTLARQVVDDLDDPFRVSELSLATLREDPSRFADEAAALALTGGRRVVRLRAAGDKQAAVIAAYLSDPIGDSLILVESGELPPRSKLRKAFESSKIAAALPCFPDEGNALERVIEQTATTLALTFEPAALRYLCAALGGDRLMTRGEIEKLALYMGEDKRVTLAHAEACVGDSSILTLDGIVMAVAGGDLAAVERGLARAALEGSAPVSILRAMARHLQRLHLLAGAGQRGESTQQAIRAMRPPLHFKLEKALSYQSRRWPVARVSGAMEIILDAERACKTTGLPADALCGRALMRVAWAARAAGSAAARF